MTGKAEVRSFPNWLPASYFDAIPASDAELEPDMILFSGARAQRENAEFLARDYWLDEVSEEWWIFGESGQGDHWLLHTDSQVYFFNHDRGQRSPDRFDFVVESVAQWVEVASLLRAADGIATPGAEVSAALELVSSGLASRFPFAVA